MSDEVLTKSLLCLSGTLFGSGVAHILTKYFVIGYGIFLGMLVGITFIFTREMMRRFNERIDG